MEKRTPNDADDAALWGASSASLGSCFNFCCLCPLGRHETGLACIAQAKPYKMCMLHGFWARFAHMSSTFVAPKLVQRVRRGCYSQLIAKKNTVVG